jgi:hypothetical protein
MKYLIALLLYINISLAGFAQDTTATPKYPNKMLGAKNDEGFNKENLFTGGSLTLGISSYGTVLGADPVFGYSVNDWLDAGIALNFTYNSQNVYDIYGDIVEKDKQTIIGPGAFVKIYPVNFLFIQAQFEHNFITDKASYPGSYGTSGTLNYDVTSFLTGIGYSGGREGKGSLFYYIAVLADLSGNYYSPYLNHFSDGTTSIAPIFRAGLQIPLFQGKHGGRY